MLIRFIVKNFRSFYEESVFSMFPSDSHEHPEHIIRGGEQTHIDVLQLGILYGANASGKSNLIRAMNFARHLIVEGTNKRKQRIPVEPFKLKQTALTEPSKFEFELIVEERSYAYGFSVDSQRVHDEWLYLLEADGETVLFERVTDDAHETTVNFPNPDKLTTTDTQFLTFVERSTRANQLFLSHADENNVEDFKSIFDWFNDILVIVFPESKAYTLPLHIHTDGSIRSALSKFLQQMYTGIEQVCLTPIEDKMSIGLPPTALKELENKLSSLDDKAALVFDSPKGRYVAVCDQQGQAILYALGTMHVDETGKAVNFEISEESDGTRRLFDLFPVMHLEERRVFVIDELERSLHPNLVKQFIQYMLQQEKKNQLIFSTHESALLDLKLLRRDEIWFVKKQAKRESTLYSLEEFILDADIDISKGYLHGRFGAVPILRSSLAAIMEEEEV